MTSSLAIRFASAALLVAALPLRAHAGGAIVTAHELTMTIKVTSQGQTNSGEDRFDSSTLKVNDVFELCTGSKPTKTQGVFLFMNCSNLNNNEIDAIGTQPLTGIASVGAINFDLAHLVDATKNGDRKSASVPVTLEIDCGGGALVAAVSGIMDIKYSALGQTVCPESAQVKITGSATSNNLGEPPSFIVDDGSSVKAKNRSGSIATFPPPF
jgi:hypothetical protein